jgi:DNA-directed RNA polymerase specialized sigma24 family protein
MAATVASLQSARMTSPLVTADAAWQPSPTLELEEDDLILIRRLAAKDRQAFETLSHRYARRLYGYLARFIMQQEAAEEVLNDVMLVI